MGTPLTFKVALVHLLRSLRVRACERLLHACERLLHACERLMHLRIMPVRWRLLRVSHGVSPGSV